MTFERKERISENLPQAGLLEKNDYKERNDLKNGKVRGGTERGDGEGI